MRTAGWIAGCAAAPALIAADMQPAMVGLTATQGKTIADKDLNRDFVIEGHLSADPERRELRRSLGYLSGR
jgi:hypothetical protein